MRQGETFLTSLGADAYEGFSAYTNDQGTSQSTVLLQKRKKMQEVQLELDQKKAEYEERMRKCKMMEEELAMKQRKIEESISRFQKFVKENDAKQARAVRKEKEEMVSARQKQFEIENMRTNLAALKEKSSSLMAEVKRMSIYESYLESVVDMSDEHTEVEELLSREATLSACNSDLNNEAEDLKKRLEDTRTHISNFIKERDDTVLVYMSDVASLRKKQESLRDEAGKLESELADQSDQFNERQRSLGTTKMAILNIFERCKKSHHAGHLTRVGEESGVEKVLEYIERRMTELADITKSWTAEGGAEKMYYY